MRTQKMNVEVTITHTHTQREEEKKTHVCTELFPTKKYVLFTIENIFIIHPMKVFVQFQNMLGNMGGAM